MKIISLVDNECSLNYEKVHGLSFYVETSKHKLLFDLGPDETFLKNAKKKHLDLTLVDTVIISHGHQDHGGALGLFLEINKTARVYIQRRAFLKHTNIRTLPVRDISLDQKYMNHPQVTLLDGDYELDDELSLFVVKDKDLYHSKMNDTLCEEGNKDLFLHEQNLLINDHKLVLIMGCAHMGAINILEHVKSPVSLVLGGFHLYNRHNDETVSEELLDLLSLKLNEHQNTLFYTCHCTGLKAYNYLKTRVKNLHYLRSGEEINYH